MCHESLRGENKTKPDVKKPLQVKDTPKDAGTLVTGGSPRGLGYLFGWCYLGETGMVRWLS